MSIVWLILMVVLVVIEGATVALTTVWFAFGSLAALLLSLVHAPLWLQILAFWLSPSSCCSSQGRLLRNTSTETG